MSENLSGYLIGYSVRLKDGAGPDMCVEDVLPVLNDYRYRCTWVDANGTIQLADHRGDQLERVPVSPSAETKVFTTAEIMRAHRCPL